MQLAPTFRLELDQPAYGLTLQNIGSVMLIMELLRPLG